MPVPHSSPWLRFQSPLVEQAVDRIVHRYRRLGAVLLDPDVGDDYLTAPVTRATLTLA